MLLGCAAQNNSVFLNLPIITIEKYSCRECIHAHVSQLMFLSYYKLLNACMRLDETVKFMPN